MKMKAIVCKEFSEDGSGLRVEEVEQPLLQNGEVLIKVECSSVHPSDAMMVQGVYSRGATLPFKAGLVGVGRVTDRKKAGVAGWFMNNKRVVFAMPEPKFGAWAEYVTTQPSLCFPLPDHLPSESAVNLLSNGATAVGIAGILKKAKTRGAVVTAAAGDFGRLMRHHLRDKGMFVIGVVRSEEQVKKLTDEGERYVLNMSEPDFDKQLTEICSRLNVTAAVESIAGDMPERLFSAMPMKSKVIMIGRLSGEPIQVDAMNKLIAKDGVIEGFNVGHWFADQSMISAVRALRQASTLLTKFPPPPPQHGYSLEELVRNFDKATSGTTAGKTIIYPHKTATAITTR